MMDLIDRKELLRVFMDGSLDFDSAIELIESIPSVDAIPVGCLELEKRDCSFSEQCDMGSSYTRERERACKNIIDWWKTPSYQKCLSVATDRGFVSKKW